MRNKTAILIIGPLPPPMGGIATFVNDMLKSDLITEYDVLHLNTVRSLKIKRSFAKNITLFYENTLRLIYLLSIKRPKIVHIHASSFQSFWEKSIFLIISRLFFKKIIVHVHGAEFDKFYMNSHRINKFLIKNILKLSDKVIVLSMYWKLFFLQILNEDKICVIRNGINFSQFESYKKNNPDKKNYKYIKILFLGNIVKRKGVFDILSSIPIVQKRYKDVHFIFAGSEEKYGEIEQIKNICMMNGIDTNIEFKLKFDNQEKIKLLFESDIFILPSYAEGLPISLLEAMAAGLPIISTPVGGIPEVIEEGKNGFLITSGDYASLADRIIRLIENKEVRSMIGRNNQEKIRREYDWSTVSKKIRDEYEILS